MLKSKFKNTTIRIILFLGLIIGVCLILMNTIKIIDFTNLKKNLTRNWRHNLYRSKKKVLKTKIIKHEDNHEIYQLYLETHLILESKLQSYFGILLHNE